MRYDRKRYMRWLAALLIVVLCTNGMNIDKIWSGKRAQAKYYISMTDFYNGGAFGAEYQMAKAGTPVSIADWNELQMFLACLYLDGRTKDVTFVQTEDIKASDLTVQAEGATGRIELLNKGSYQGEMDNQGRFYKEKNGTQTASRLEMGLEDVYLSREKDCYFEGEYQGEGHSISGLMIEGGESYCSGVFGTLKQTASIRDLTVENCLLIDGFGTLSGVNDGTVQDCTIRNVAGYGFFMGGVTESNAGTIRGCNVTGCDFMTDADLNGALPQQRLGGITAGNYGGTIEDCTVTDTHLYGMDLEDTRIGGIVAEAHFDAPSHTIRGCSSRVILSGGTYMGGILGRTDTTTGQTQIKDCVSSCTFQDTDQAQAMGGILAEAVKGTSVLLQNCRNESELAIQSTWNGKDNVCMGGIVGSLRGAFTISDCMNQGMIVSEKEDWQDLSLGAMAGGIVGIANGEESGILANCQSEGNVTVGQNTENECAGGIVGFLGNPEAKHIYNAKNTGAVTGRYAGGLAGYVYGLSGQDMVISNSFSTGVVVGKTTGALMGRMKHGGMEYCYYKEKSAPDMVGEQEDSLLTQCYVVTQPQLTGTEMAAMIGSSESSYASKNTLLEVLNQWVQGNTQLQSVSMHSWCAGAEGIPTIINKEADNLPTLPPVGTTTPQPTGQNTAMSSSEPQPTDQNTAIPSSEPQPTGQDTAMPSSEPQPMGQNTAMPSGKPQPADNGTSMSPDLSEDEDDDQEQLAIRWVKAAQTKKGSIRITWKNNMAADGYVIYRKAAKKTAYKQIKYVSGVTSFTDTSVKRGSKYTYAVCGLRRISGQKIYGMKKEAAGVTLGWLSRPVIALKQGKMADGTYYVQIRLKKYQGKKIEISVSNDNKKYVAVPLKSSNIAKYQGVFRLTYARKGKQLYCRVRTIQKLQGKKRYSAYSEVKKIKM